MLKIACQEQLLPGDDLEASGSSPPDAGYDAIELRGKRRPRASAKRLPELRRAPADGVVMPTVCVDMLHFLGAFDDELRRDAVAQMKSQLSRDRRARRARRHDPRLLRDVLPPPAALRAAAQRGRGPRRCCSPGSPSWASTPAGRASRSPRTAEPVRGPHGQPAGAGRGPDRRGRPGLGPDRRDSYHMNIEEADPAGRDPAAAPPTSGTPRSATPTGSSPARATWTGPPGSAPCDAVGYDGYLAVECRSPANPREAVRLRPRRSCGGRRHDGLHRPR